MFTISKHATAVGLLTTVVSLGACGSVPDGPAGTASAAQVSSNLDIQSCQSPSLPSPTLAVPVGNKLKFFYDAVGVQIYACQATATGFGWVFKHRRRPCSTGMAGWPASTCWPHVGRQ